MDAVAKVLTKGRAIILKGPETLRNIAFSKLGIWPVGRLLDEELRSLPVYCISLTRASQRRRIMLRQAQQMGLERFEFIDAIDATGRTAEALDGQGLYSDAASQKLHGRSLTPAEIAGSLSHGMVYDLMLARNDAMALVLEDDALFMTRRLNRFRLGHIPPDAEIVFLNSFVALGRPSDQICGQLYGVGAYTGSAAAYLLSASGARKLARAYKPVASAADGLLGRVLPAPDGSPHPFKQAHPFKQIGVDTQLTGYLVYPDYVLNGSVCYYYNTYLAQARKSY